MALCATFCQCSCNDVTPQGVYFKMEGKFSVCAKHDHKRTSLPQTPQGSCKLKQSKNAMQELSNVCKGIKQHNTTTIWKRIEVV
ncbi:MAG: hypothetical protein IKC52_04540 [Clostridia bacterium]|nr:hypothetical protein [Clostridia bacterium]MBR2966718.1 hypothetical protein [Clostridia bacterium]